MFSTLKSSARIKRMKKFPVTMQDLLSDQVEEVLPNKKGLEDLM